MKFVSKILPDDIYDVISWNGSNTDEIAEFMQVKPIHVTNSMTGEDYLHCEYGEGIMRIGKHEYAMRSHRDGSINVMSPNIIFEYYKALKP